jgi:hypothetical protein
MARQQWAQPVTAITTPLAGVHIGTQVFAVVGTNGIRRGFSTRLIFGLNQVGDHRVAFNEPYPMVLLAGTNYRGARSPGPRALIAITDGTLWVRRLKGD